MYAPSLNEIHERVFASTHIQLKTYGSHGTTDLKPVYPSGKDSKPDSWFLFDSYKHKQNPVTEVQELVPKMSHISHQTYKILH